MPGSATTQNLPIWITESSNAGECGILHFVEKKKYRPNEIVNNWEQILAYLFFFSLYCLPWIREASGRRNKAQEERGKRMEKIYQVSEAAEELETEVYTLRYWENQLGLEVPRNASGHRYYEETQILMFRNVKRLKDAGFGLRQIKAMGERMSAVAALPDEKLQELRNRILGMEAEQEEVFCGKEVKMQTEKNEEKRGNTVTLPTCVEEATECGATLPEERADGVRMLQEGMTKWLGEMLQKNNEQLSKKIEDGVSERMARELRFLFRQQEEREEERYRRLDRTIREYQQARANQKPAAGARECFRFPGKLRPLR